MKVWAVTYDTNCDHAGCIKKATGLYGDLTLCDEHLEVQKKVPMSRAEREMWKKINDERAGIYPGDFD